jgi:small multidrug resistance family-3 protein
MLIAKSLLYFVLTGICELGGAYLIWLWLREKKSIWYALAGAVVLFLFQPFSRPILGACRRRTVDFSCYLPFYGGGVDKIRPDKFDIIGSAVAFLGMLIIMYAPRDS